ncbi:MAG: hypothetical protein COV10_01130 [Candidatus Vogelbacteria bacterium CG10_big_fil_rev_8_21_14_0_10_51_16]|uniref:Uncharacterized protein n=1 Tax=Candidatus Vogelbacteria bacterium CG10_big_fil_rev_8_21_14_0_10_51_16 TaxID=1975045 RepID=A0A2H0REY2_9BACT|nr:MAG: hypothetical protein COV10_01130 [Candidatus Vogelbacteria bacterium CG10_big_fil_rev_8_21_14_0_10_51_16]
MLLTFPNQLNEKHASFVPRLAFPKNIFHRTYSTAQAIFRSKPARETNDIVFVLVKLIRKGQ